jgi:hypothetical protein
MRPTRTVEKLGHPDGFIEGPDSVVPLQEAEKGAHVEVATAAPVVFIVFARHIIRREDV